MGNRRATEPKVCPCGKEYFPWVRRGSEPPSAYCSIPCRTEYGGWQWKFGRKAKEASA